ncbi:MAG: TolC family protein [Acidobacteria bacterium]|nr:TolC family protein [Acidobacteriota bacterium]
MPSGTRKLTTFFIIAAATLLPASAWDESQPLSLETAVRLALERHPDIQIALDQMSELRGKITEVRSSAFPQVSFQGFGLRLRDPSILNSSSFDEVPQEFRDALVPRASNMFDMGVTVRQPLYTAGKVGAALRLAEASLEEAETNGDSVREQLTFLVFQAFQNLLLAEANRDVVRETYGQRVKHLEQARIRLENGVATEIDVLRSEVNVANMEPELIRADNQVRLARSGLNSLIVTDLENPTRVEGNLEFHPWMPGDLASVQDRTLAQRKSLQALRHQLEQAKWTLSLAHAENRLSVDLEGQIGYTVRKPENFFDNDFSRWSITANFNLPLFDSGRKSGLVVQAQARVRAAEHRLAKSENDVRLEVKQAYDDMESSAKAIFAARLSVRQAEKVLEMMQANYQYGAATTLDVLDSQTALAVARNAQISAIYEYEMTKARLRLASGSPILDREGNR